MENRGEILIYQSQQGATKVDVRMQDETVWLSLNQISELFQKAKSTVIEHISNIFEEGKLQSKATVRNFRTVASEGKRRVSRDTEFYNLEPDELDKAIKKIQEQKTNNGKTENRKER